MPRTHGSPSLTVQITEENWERAIASNSGGCLIADALKAQYPEYTGVTVDMATIRFSDRKSGQRFTYLTPQSGQHLLLSLDQGWASKMISEIILKRAVKIDRIIRSPKEKAAKEARRLERKAELEAKVEAGEGLTPPEKRALARVSNPKPIPERPTVRGPVEVKGDASRGNVTVYGGNLIPQGEAHPNLLRGRDRHFGAKLADPGTAFREAVEQAVAARLGEET